MTAPVAFSWTGRGWAPKAPKKALYFDLQYKKKKKTASHRMWLCRIEIFISIAAFALCYLLFQVKFFGEEVLKENF